MDEVGGEAYSAASISQVMLASKLLSLVAVDVRGLSDEMPLFSASLRIMVGFSLFVTLGLLFFNSFSLISRKFLPPNLQLQLD